MLRGSSTVAPLAKICEVFVELGVDPVNIAANCCSKHTQILQVVPQRLGGGDGVDGGEAHDDLVHEWGVLNAVEDVLILVGEQCLFR